MTIKYILHNGKILTVDKDNRKVEAIAISDNKFVAVGGNDEVMALGTKDTKCIDLQGKTVIPGIVDSHNHVPTAGMMLDGVLLFGAQDIAEMQERVAARVARAQPGEWVIGGGWIESQFKEYRLPTRWDLDKVSPDNPVILGRLFAGVVVNSRALEIAGIDKDTPDPWRGRIHRNETGAATGVLYEGAANLVRKMMPRLSVENTLANTQANITRAMKEYVKWGITTILDPGVSSLNRLAYFDLYRQGKLPIRMNMMPVWYGLSASHESDMDALVEHMGIFNGFGNEWISLGALKMAIDGGLGSKTAMLHKPYLDGSQPDIPLRLDINKLEDYFRLAHKHYWSVGIHTCGDLAQDMAVDALSKVIEETPRAGMRHNIIHGYLPTPQALEKMAKHNIAVSVQPGFMYVEGDIYFDVVEEERVNYFTPLRTYLDAGIMVAANSDMTSAHYNPFLGMYSAVARKTSQGRSMGEEERITREEMLRLFTINGAYLSFMEDKVGSIEVGKLADLAILSGDILTVPEEEIKNLEVDMTFIDGKVVHQR